MQPVTVTPEKIDDDTYIIVKLSNSDVKELQECVKMVQQHLSGSGQFNPKDSADIKRKKKQDRLIQDLHGVWAILNPS